MELEPRHINGKEYKTEDGSKAWIYSMDNPGPYPLHGAYEHKGERHIVTWNREGKYDATGSFDNANIIGPWEEPKPKRKFFAYLPIPHREDVATSMRWYRSEQGINLSLIRAPKFDFTEGEE